MTPANSNGYTNKNSERDRFEAEPITLSTYRSSPGPSYQNPGDFVSCRDTILVCI